MTDVGDGPAGGTPSTAINGDASDAVLLESVSQGSVPAFRALVERTSMAVSAVLADLVSDREGRDEILAATYLEVWWLAGCHIQPDVDATNWIVGIARRRAAESHADLVPDRERPRTGYAQLEFATLLRRPAGVPGR
jgi:DNA-directed RNA polymerase specialized sigma24 family protein